MKEWATLGKRRHRHLRRAPSRIRPKLSSGARSPRFQLGQKSPGSISQPYPRSGTASAFRSSTVRSSTVIDRARHQRPHARPGDSGRGSRTLRRDVSRRNRCLSFSAHYLAGKLRPNLHEPRASLPDSVAFWGSSAPIPHLATTLAGNALLPEPIDGMDSRDAAASGWDG